MDAVTLTSSLGTVVKNANGTWTWSLTPTSKLTNQQISITASDKDGGITVRTFNVTANPAVTNSQVYYKNSFYAAGGTNVSGGLDPSKQLAKSGATTTTLSAANITNYSRGINGLVFDIAGLVGSTLTTADFAFRMSPQGGLAVNQSPSTWSSAPAPTAIVVTPGSTSRVRLEWADNAIENRWLQVQLLANANTGFASNQTFYIGNLKGEIDGVLTGSNYIVQDADITQALPVGALGTVGSARDVDRNGYIVNADFTQIRAAINAAINTNMRLTQIIVPAAGSSNEAPSLPPEPPLAPSSLQSGGLTAEGEASFSAAPVVTSNIVAPTITAKANRRSARDQFFAELGSE